MYLKGKAIDAEYKDGRNPDNPEAKAVENGKTRLMTKSATRFYVGMTTAPNDLRNIRFSH